MQIIKEKKDIEKRIKTILKILNIKSKIERGNIISIMILIYLINYLNA